MNWMNNILQGHAYHYRVSRLSWRRVPASLLHHSHTMLSHSCKENREQRSPECKSRKRWMYIDPDWCVMSGGTFFSNSLAAFNYNLSPCFSFSSSFSSPTPSLCLASDQHTLVGVALSSRVELVRSHSLCFCLSLLCLFLLSLSLSCFE